MNAKFEKWYGHEHVKRDGFGDYTSHTATQFIAWQAAIQSLEVTPDLCRIAEAAYDAEPATPICDSPAMKEALKAFLSALKEQAK